MRLKRFNKNKNKLDGTEKGENIRSFLPSLVCGAGAGNGGALRAGAGSDSLASTMGTGQSRNSADSGVTSAPGLITGSLPWLPQQPIPSVPTQTKPLSSAEMPGHRKLSKIQTLASCPKRGEKRTPAKARWCWPAL